MRRFARSFLISFSVLPDVAENNRSELAICEPRSKVEVGVCLVGAQSRRDGSTCRLTYVEPFAITLGTMAT
jgi:hypothetical protein